MKTSYHKELPTVTQIEATLNSNPNTETFTASPTTKRLFWEDGGGNEIRIIHNDSLTLITLYDNESDQNFYPDRPHRQTALLEAPDEVTDFIDEVKEELLWHWDTTNEIWYTAAFWNLNSTDWETSYDWEENHDEDSLNWMLTTLKDKILN